MESTKKRLRHTPSPADAEPFSSPANGAVLPAEDVSDNPMQDRSPSFTATEGKSNPRRERVFSSEDETMLLQSLCQALENSASSFPIVKNYIDTPILTEIVESLGSRFTPIQISDKLRGLWAKYVKLKRSKSTSKSDHDAQIYDLGRKIWGKDKAQASTPTNHGQANGGQSSRPGADVPVETAPNGVKRKKRDEEKAKDACLTPTIRGEANGEQSSRPGAEFPVETAPNGVKRKKRDEEKAKDACPTPMIHGEANGEQSSRPGAEVPVEIAPNGVKRKKRDKERIASKSKESGFDLAKFPFLVEECRMVLELGNGVWRKVLKALPEEKLREMNDKFAMVKCEEADIMSKKSQVVTELTRLILGAVAASQPPT